MTAGPFPERLRCPSCSGYVSGASTCPTCGAVLPLEDALQSIRSSILRRIGEYLSVFRKRPAYWIAWALAVIPLFLVPPLLSLALVFSWNDRASRDPFLMIVAVINVVLSIYFWHEAGDHLIAMIQDIAGWLKLFGIPKGPGLLEV